MIFKPHIAYKEVKNGYVDMNIKCKEIWINIRYSIQGIYTV